MKFCIKDFSSKYDQIRGKLRIWSHLLENSPMENFIFCAVLAIMQHSDSCQAIGQIVTQENLRI